jgi:hypothetical protein
MLKCQAKRFSTLVLSNSITIEDKKVYFKLFLLTLDKPPHERTEEDNLTTAKILNE